MTYSAEHIPQTEHSCSRMREAFTAADPASSIMSSSRARRLAQRFTARGLSLRAASRAAATKPSAAMSISGCEEGGCVKRGLSVGAVRVPNITYPMSIARLVMASTPQGGNPDMAQALRQGVCVENFNSCMSRNTHSVSAWSAAFAASPSAPCCCITSTAISTQTMAWLRCRLGRLAAKPVARAVRANKPGAGTDIRGVYSAACIPRHGSQVAMRHRRRAQTVACHFVTGRPVAANPHQAVEA